MFENDINTEEELEQAIANEAEEKEEEKESLFFTTSEFKDIGFCNECRLEKTCGVLAMVNKNQMKRYAKTVNDRYFCAAYEEPDNFTITG